MPREPRPTGVAKADMAENTDVRKAKTVTKANADKASDKLEAKKVKAKAKEVSQADEVADAVPSKKRRAAEAASQAEGGQPAAKKRRNDDAAATAADKGAEAGAVALLSAAAFREAHEIRVNDKACPDPMQDFAEATKHFGKELVKAMTKQGYTAPTPIQSQAWPIALQGKDMVAVAKTGSGKTCGFLLPALARIMERGPAPPLKKISYWATEPAAPTVLVLAPTRELAQQIAGEAAKFAPVANAKVVSVYGGVPRGEQVRELTKGCDVLIATPGRLLDFLNPPSKTLNPAVKVSSVTYLVLDEADRMLDMGFEPSIREIVDLCPGAGKPEEGGGASGPTAGTKRQTLFFTATWPKAVQTTAASLTSASAVQVRIGQGADGDTLSANKNVKQMVYVLREHEKLAKLKELVASELGKGETGMVFAAMKTTCDELARELKGALPSMWCRTIHSGLDQWERDQVLSKFRDLTAGRAKGEKGVLVCTDVASRGLDIPGVAAVFVYDFGRALKSGMNGGVETYVHRIGRTGRAGKTGRAYTFFTSEDRGARELATLLRDANQEVPADLEQMARQGGRKGGGSNSWGQSRWGGKGKGGKGKGKGKGKSSWHSW